MSLNYSRWPIIFLPDIEDALVDYIDTIFAPNKDEANLIFNLMVNCRKWQFYRKDGIYIMCDENDNHLCECRIKGNILN